MIWTALVKVGLGGMAGSALLADQVPTASNWGLGLSFGLAGVAIVMSLKHMQNAKQHVTDRDHFMQGDATDLERRDVADGKWSKQTEICLNAQKEMAKIDGKMDKVLISTTKLEQRTTLLLAKVFHRPDIIEREADPGKTMLGQKYKEFNGGDP